MPFSSHPIVDAFETSEAYARRLDEHDPLHEERANFHVPLQPNGTPFIYLCGNSLGLQPVHAADYVEQELHDWRELAVEAHFKGKTPWYTYHECVREPLERLVGAKPGAGEVVAMNGLTANLHLMMVSFFRPTKRRRKILIDWPAFPSDIYAVQSHLTTRGLDPEADMIIVRPREGEETLRTEDLEARIRDAGDELALVLVAGVNFYTGQRMDLERLARTTHGIGAMFGADLAHAVGNVPLDLHEWDVDFAVWCSYKYLNGGPGAIAGCFVHERHVGDVDRPRFGGWWGNDPETRFKMHLEETFRPRAHADGWQLGNPPILAIAPLRASLDIFDRVGLDAVRAKSLRMTGYLRYLLDRQDWFEVLTPTGPEVSGCQLSLFVHDRPRARFEAMEAAGVIADFREPNVIRIAPAPLYNTYHEIWTFADALSR